MKHKSIKILTFLSLLIALAACSPAATPAPTALPPTVALPTEAPPTEIPPTESVAPTGVPPEPTAPPADTTGVSFATDVQPILDSRCASCHGLERTSGGFDLTSLERLMAGGEEGAAVLPGDASASPLVTLAESGKMPKSGPKLTPAQLQLLKDWIDQGALNN